MNDKITMQPIAVIRNDFKAKFGIPRQSGLTSTLSTIVFEPKYRKPDALRGLEQFTHLWIIWLFSEAHQYEWSPTVRPPKLGGNTKVGVFATRSPFRPNSIGLSSVKISRIYDDGENGTVIEVEGADILDGTPVLDVKPYLPYTDCHTDAKNGFALDNTDGTLSVIIPDDIKTRLGERITREITEVLAQDPRPAYHDDGRVYGLEYSRFDVKFAVVGEKLTVSEIVEK